MHCNNFLNVKHWLNEFENKNIIIRRYPYVKIEHISPEDPAVILMNNCIKIFGRENRVC